MRAIYCGGEILYNETNIDDKELLPVMKMVEKSGISVYVNSWDMEFFLVNNIVYAQKRSFIDKAAQIKSDLFTVLWRIKPYPSLIEETANEMNFSGFHTILVVGGEVRYEIRRKMRYEAELIRSTEDLDFYFSNGKYGGKIFENMGICWGNDSRENLRRALLALYSFGGGIYDNVIESKIGKFDLNGFDPFKETDIEWLVGALRLFKKSMVDVRIPRELFAVLRSLRRAVEK